MIPGTGMARFVTDFADEAVLLPLATGVALLFAVLGWRRGAIAWVAAVGGAMATMLLLKLVFIACGPCWFGDALSSPSGHTAAGTAVYGGLAGLLLRRYGPWPRLLAAACIAVVIAVSRLALSLHTGPEVLLGGLVGTAGAMLFVRAAGAPARVRSWQLAALACAAGVALHGLHLPAELSIRRAAFDLWPMCRQCR